MQPLRSVVTYFGSEFLVFLSAQTRLSSAAARRRRNETGCSKRTEGAVRALSRSGCGL